MTPKAVPISKDIFGKYGYTFYTSPFSLDYLKKMHEEFMKNPENFTIQEYEPMYFMKDDNTLFFRYFKEIIQNYEDIGIKFIFFNSPGYSLTAIRSSFENFVKSYPMITISKKEYPEIFVKENYFNDSHLNINGTKLVTDIIINEYRSLTKKDAF